MHLILRLPGWRFGAKGSDVLDFAAYFIKLALLEMK